MNIQATKIELVKAILNSDNIDFIKKIAEFIRVEQKDIWETLSLEQQKEIEKGIEELNEGKRVSFESFLKKIS